MLRKDYQRALRQEWAPLLIALDGLPISKHPDGAQIMKIVRQGWWKLGNVGASLDEEKEKTDYAKRAEKMCSWRECCWYTLEPPIPTKLCRGCGEAVRSLHLRIARKLTVRVEILQYTMPTPVSIELRASLHNELTSPFL